MIATMLAALDKVAALDPALIFPALLLVLNVGAAIVSLTRGDWNRGVYWLASGVCIAVVTFR